MPIFGIVRGSVLHLKLVDFWILLFFLMDDVAVNFMDIVFLKYKFTLLCMKT